MRHTRLWLTATVLATATTIVAARPAPQDTLTIPAPTSTSQTLARFSVTPIDVDYPSTNLRAVLRVLADVANVNLVVDPSVSTDATVDLKLGQVPWNQVMDVVLKSSQLVYEVDGNVLRVMTRDAQTKEFKDQADRRLASQQAPDLTTLRQRLSYAKAPEVAALLAKAGFGSTVGGSINSEDRTNMIIVKDIPANVEEIRLLLAELDRAEPQVEIEARIVQTDSTTARSLGVQWGFNGRVSPELGNTTNLSFPNNGSVGGRVNGSQGPSVQGSSDPRANALNNTSTAVNLAVPGATSGVGISMGAINGAFNLDVALSALEHKGKLRIVSTPHITTQNNKQAEVTQGFEIPYQVVTNNTVTVQFKDAALKLIVTPQITSANTIIMRVQLENGAPDPSQSVNGNPAIRTDRADTQVQVPDGMTTVIGGIKQITDSNSKDKTPGVGNIPLLGWLFRNDQTSNREQELLIFITPRIVRGES